MTENIEDLFFTANALDSDGRLFISDRGLSVPVAQKMGIASRDGWIYFPFLRNGKVVRWKRRLMADKKQQSTSKLEDAEKETFKMPFFNALNALESKILYITEGEFDCVAIAQLGASNCVSLPHGSGSVESAFRNNYEYLQQFEKIVLCFDMDDPGEQAVKKAVSMLPPSKVSRLVFPKPYKDANEWLANEMPDEADFKRLVNNAIKFEIPCMTCGKDLPMSYYEAIDLGISTGFKQLDKLLGGFRLGEVTVITADTGAGKSTFCINLMKNIAERGGGIWINSYEMDPKMVNRKMASAVLKKKFKTQDFSAEDLNAYLAWQKAHKYYLNVSNEKVDLIELRKQFELASLAYGVKYILIDHLDYIHANGKKQTALENIDESVREIHALALEFKVKVFLVVHPKQMDSKREVTMHDLKGSSAIKQYADNILAITRMDRINENDKLRVKVQIFKNRLLGLEGQFSLRYIPECDGYTESY